MSVAWITQLGLIVKMYFQYGTMEYIFFKVKFMPISFFTMNVLLAVMM